MGSAMVPLDMALLTSYRLSIVTACPQFVMQILTEVPIPQISPSVGDHTPSLTQCYLGPQVCPCQMASHFIQQLYQGAQF